MVSNAKWLGILDYIMSIFIYNAMGLQTCFKSQKNSINLKDIWNKRW